MSENIVKEDKKGYYTIVAPGTIQADFDYVVTVTVLDISEPATINVSISGPSYNESKTIEVTPFASQMVLFCLPAILQEGDYELKTEGTSGIIFKESSKLHHKCVKPKVYIQTDKAMYKPGDLVQYRVIALDEDTKPAKLKEPLNLGIRDGAQNHIKQIKDIQFNKGVHAGKFQLSEEPVLGNWIIDITAGEENKEKTEKGFEVAKYVLPKFSVELEGDKQVAVLDKKFKITVRSKYTYGKPVKGKAAITAKFKSFEGNTPAAEKVLDIDGKGEVEFDLMEDLKMEHQLDSYMPQIDVVAVMTEAFTGLEQTTTTTIDVRRSRFTITLPNMCNEYEVNKPIEIKAIIKRLNGKPVTNARSTAKLMVGTYGQFRGGFRCGIPSGANDLMFESDVDQNGIALFNFKLSKAGDYSSIKVMYEEEMHQAQGFKVKSGKETEAKPADNLFGAPMEVVGPINIFPKSREPEIGEEFTVDIKSCKNLTYFIYTIMARGKIIKHEYVKVEPESKCHTLKLRATFEMAPTANIIAYFVEDGELRSDETTIKIPNKFENQLEITAPEEAKASDDVTLSIKTEPDSYVGLLGVDQSVLLLQSGNDLDKETIYSDLHSYSSDTFLGGRIHYSSPGVSSGFVTQTNAKVPQPRLRRKKTTKSAPMMCYRSMAMKASAPMAMAAFGGAPAPENMVAYCDTDFLADSTPLIKPKIRKDFAETWIFEDIESTDEQGLTTFSKKIPDTITSWVITGFSLNDTKGFGMTQDATKIRVFQPFFLSTNLPYSIKRGEVIKIPIVVFNYMEMDLDAQITMENDEGEYDFVDSDGGETDDKEMTKKLSIPSNTGETVSFTIKPKIVGEIMLKIKAITPLAGDAMHQKLKVEPEGVTQYENEAFFITIPDGEPINHTLKAQIPDDVVLDSEYLEFTAVGDLLGPTIKNIDKLVRMPFGCGEQNMINFVPNIMVLQYLEAIKMDMPSTVQKAKNYMETGYQRELTYKHSDGSYSAFGDGHSDSNSWLTAYVARSFMQARKYITIDEKIISDALEYLIKTQKENGQFPQTGKLFHSSNQNELGVSAFILMTLLEDKEYASKYGSQIEKSLQYLSDNVDSEDNLYSLALILAVFQKAKHPLAEKILERVQLKSKYENNLKWWSNSLKYCNNDIEVTAYIFQSLVETEEAGKLLPIIKWLVGQRNSLGGFDSTQDTVVGLKALIAFAEKYAASGDGKMTIQFEAQTEEGIETTTGEFSVDKENALLLQSHVLPKATRQITLKAEGEGSSLIQLSYRYNVASQKAPPSFTVQHTPKDSYPGQLFMNICAEYSPESDEVKESNMAVMEINLPSGYTIDNDSLKPIREAKRVQRVETKNDDTVVVVYFDSLVAGEPTCFDVSADKSHEVDALKPAAITIYDYYNAEQRATIYYEVSQ
ncbi:CD109 antigen isoform X1 [Stomoxys calcitrans]|uniref:CD109 antigen isoform X1 n=1 Tax=Stomoxys calcitrans TaxID=35570 RepID=UPI0027E37CAC|nr:CD109 antigen isoform X1 [Stomoxys calcitrans]